MDPLLLTGLVQGLSSFGVDALFGGSSDVEEAQDSYIKKISDIVLRLKKDAGKSTSDSLFYKTAMKLLDDKYGEDLKKQRGLEVVTGATNEAKIAGMNQINRSRNDAQVRTLGVAEEKRNSLLDKAESYDLAGDQMKIGIAENAQKNLSGLAPVAASGVTALIGALKGGSVKGLENLATAGLTHELTHANN